MEYIDYLLARTNLSVMINKFMFKRIKMKEGEAKDSITQSVDDLYFALNAIDKLYAENKLITQQNVSYTRMTFDMKYEVEKLKKEKQELEEKIRILIEE